MEKDPPEDARAYPQAIRLLARREHSRQELEQKLLQRGHAAAAVADTLERLQGEGYLDESRFVELYIRQRGQKGYGPVRIRQELQERGVAPGLIQTGLRDCDEDWDELARAAYRKKFGGGSAVDWKEKARRMRYLQYRGFTQEQIQSLMDAVN